MSDLREQTLAECLKVSRLACVIFDDVESDSISAVTAQAVVDMNESVHVIHGALVAAMLQRRL